jgi:hypothetical protein
LVYIPGDGHEDDVIRHLGTAMQVAVRRPEEANQVFVDHAMLAFTSRVTSAYGARR